VKKFFIRLAAVVLGVPLFLLATVCAANLIAGRMEADRFPPPGKMVTVDGKKMHVFSEGFGGPTVVLLAGLGSPSPYAEYRKLARVLASDHRVSQVENLGYGWSDWADSPRTTANIVAETRAALREAGLPPPYLLVPHSIAGLYALAWANTHPEELAGVLGLDTTVPAQLAYLGVPEVDSRLDLLRRSGWLRVYIAIDNFFAGRLPAEPSAGAAPADQALLDAQLAAMACRNAGNPSVAGETRLVADNAKALAGMRFPDSIPVCQVLSRDNQDFSVKSGWKEDWVAMHQGQISPSGRGRVVVLPGDHFIFRGNEERIRQLLAALPGAGGQN
jgi:pimeloyl-ACP methyl ester carboxylesterase